MKKFIWSLTLLFVFNSAFAQRAGTAPPDPFVLNDTIQNLSNSATNSMYRQTAGLTPRNQAFNSAGKMLIMIGLGQSQCTSMNPTLYTPTNSSVIDVFNIYDGASYPVGGPLIGSQYLSDQGQGNVLARLADTFVTNAIFDRVLIVPNCFGATVAADWATGTLKDRIVVIMKRLASRGYTVGASGLTFMITWWHGESDGVNGTTQAAYTASMNTVLSNVQAAGFSCATCRFFINLETYTGGVTYAPIRAAQAALPNGTTFFAGGDVDTLGSGSRQASGSGANVHWNDSGAASAASLVYTAIHASGTPF